MSTVHGGQGNIIKNGLVLWLDAANPRSYEYPYTGITWSDLSGNGNSGVLTNGPIYNSSNNGSIVFDGTNDFVSSEGVASNILSNQSSFTVAFWLKETSFDGFGSVVLSSAGSSNLFLQITTTAAYIGILGSINNYLTLPLPLTSLMLNKITNLVFVKSGNTAYLYINATKYTFPGTANFNFVGSNKIINIGKYTASGFEFTGNMYSVMVYNRAISDQEVVQNYNTTRARFGV